MKNDERRDDAVKITQQYRVRNGMTYDLKGEGHRLTLHICPRESPADLGDWRVDASLGRDAPIVSEWGSSRAIALGAVGKAWNAHFADGTGPAFDWEAVAKVLQAVRAIS